jgi:hypothetical protein
MSSPWAFTEAEAHINATVAHVITLRQARRQTCFERIEVKDNLVRFKGKVGRTKAFGEFFI